MVERMGKKVLGKELAIYKKMRPELLKHHMGKHVVIHGDTFAGAFDTFDTAAREAISQFGDGPYLIREVTEIEPRMPMPASVAFRPIYAAN